MDIDADTLGIPDTEYDASVVMPSSEFARIVRDLSGLGESVKIEVSKDGVRFSSDGESANGNILLKQTESARRRFAHVGKRNKKEKTEGDDGDDADVEEQDDDSEKKKKKKAVKKEKVKEETGDVEMTNGDGEDDGEEEFQAKSESEGEDEKSDEEESSSKKRKKAPAKSSKPTKKAKKSSDDNDVEDGEGGVRIEMNQAVALTFSLKYLVNFSKSSSLAKEVQLMLSADVPLLVSYDFEQGTISYYLAPKTGDD